MEIQLLQLNNFSNMGLFSYLGVLGHHVVARLRLKVVGVVEVDVIDTGWGVQGNIWGKNTWG